jgi:hypothetical protein
VIWQQSIWLATGFAVVAVGCILTGRRRWAAVGGWLWQCAFVVGLYTVWQLATTEWVVTSTVGAVAHGRTVAGWERTLHLPSEAWFQHLFIGDRLLLEAANGYYAALDYSALLACFLWLWWRHRDRYWSLRLTLVLTTAVCSLIQAVPVAPPRLVSSLGVVDIAARLHESVYQASGLHDPTQLTAMPSVHVAWAALVAVAVVTASRSRWRWAIVAYPVLTQFVVVVTGNHYWLDGVVGVAILGGALAAQSIRRVGETPQPALLAVPRPVVPTATGGP